MEENKTVRLESLGIKVDKVTFTLDCSEAYIYISCLPSNRYELFNLKEYHNFISVDKYEYTRFIISQIADTNPGHMVLHCYVYSMDSVDSIIVDKSHSDEPGERGEQGTTSGIPLFSDVVDVLNVKHECGSTMTYVTAARTDKTFAFLTKWDGTPPPREFLFLLKKDATDVFKLINVCIDFGGVTFEFSYYGNVMPSDGVPFFVPTLAGARGSQPLWQSGKPVSLCVPEPETPQAKEIVTLNMHMDVGEIHPDYSKCGVSAKSTLEREMDLLQRCKVNSYLFGRKEDPKFPQMRRARLNKPKSI